MVLYGAVLCLDVLIPPRRVGIDNRILPVQFVKVTIALRDFHNAFYALLPTFCRAFLLRLLCDNLRRSTVNRYGSTRDE